MLMPPLKLAALRSEQGYYPTNTKCAYTLHRGKAKPAKTKTFLPTLYQQMRRQHPQPACN